MRVAFVGKGGSGKTTLARLFTESLLAAGKTVLALDADINMHFACSFGLTPLPEKALSAETNKRAMREYIRGTNERITSSRAFVKTTPPGRGSNLIRIDPQDPCLGRYTERVSDRLLVGYVGTYESAEIGVSCYHGNLGIAENILSHIKTDKNHWVVTDMVAGTDAFSGSLHLLFDALFLIVEPTSEGLAVFHQYEELARAAGIWDHVWVLGNKVQDEQDQSFLEEHLQAKLLGVVFQDQRLRRLSQQGERMTWEMFGQEGVFYVLMQQTLSSGWHRQEQLNKLYDLHRIHAKEDYILARCGDVTDQIDPDFRFPTEAYLC